MTYVISIGAGLVYITLLVAALVASRRGCTRAALRLWWIAVPVELVALVAHLAQHAWFSAALNVACLLVLGYIIGTAPRGEAR